MTIIRALAVALALAALAVPTAQAKFVDVHQPLIEKPRPAGLDYSRNSVTGEHQPPSDTGGSQDFRHPDTIDAANGRGLEHAPEIAVVKVPTPSAPAAASSNGGVDWTDATARQGIYARAGARHRQPDRRPSLPLPRHRRLLARLQ